MKKHINLSLSVATLTVVFLLISGGSVGARGIDNPLMYDNFEELVEAIANFIFNIALVFAPIMIVIAGFYFLTAAGDPGRVATAKKIILYTLVGFAIILLSRGLVAVIREVLQVGS